MNSITFVTNLTTFDRRTSIRLSQSTFLQFGKTVSSLLFTFATNVSLAIGPKNHDERFEYKKIRCTFAQIILQIKYIETFCTFAVYYLVTRLLLKNSESEFGKCVKK